MGKHHFWGWIRKEEGSGDWNIKIFTSQIVLLGSKLVYVATLLTPRLIFKYHLSHCRFISDFAFSNFFQTIYFMNNLILFWFDLTYYQYDNHILLNLILFLIFADRCICSVWLLRWSPLQTARKWARLPLEPCGLTSKIWLNSRLLYFYFYFYSYHVQIWNFNRKLCMVRVGTSHRSTFSSPKYNILLSLPLTSIYLSLTRSFSLTHPLFLLLSPLIGTFSPNLTIGNFGAILLILMSSGKKYWKESFGNI